MGKEEALESEGRSQIVVKWEDWVGTHLRRELWERKGLWKVEGGAQLEDWDTLVIQGGGGWHQGQRDENQRGKIEKSAGRRRTLSKVTLSTQITK